MKLIEPNYNDNDVINLIFSIGDTKANSFGPPFLAKTKGEATRMFDNLVNDKREGSLIKDYPEDFILWMIGSFNLSKGILVPCAIEHIAKGIDFIKYQN